MPVRGTGDGGEAARWTGAIRVIPNIEADRAKLRLTAMYRATDDFQVGIELNPLAPDIGPIANWRALSETKDRPALIFGTSSDRIGTPHGRAIYGTFSKDLEGWTGIPIAPYAGISYGTYDDEFAGIGGLVIRWADRFTTTSMYDGYNLHHLANYNFDTASFGIVVAQQDDDYYAGVTFATSFGK